MLWLATERAAVLNVAWPPLSVPGPSVVAPSLKVTVPVGVPAPGETALTVAVRVTDWPNTEELVEEATVVVELAWLTVWVTVAEVLAGKLGAAFEMAVVGWGRTEKKEGAKWTWP